MDASVKREGRTRVDLEVFVTKHAELEDGQQIVVDLALKSDLDPRRRLGRGRVQQVRFYRRHQTCKWTVGNSHRARRAVGIDDQRLARGSVRFGKREAFSDQFGGIGGSD